MQQTRTRVKDECEKNELIARRADRKEEERKKVALEK